MGIIRRTLMLQKDRIAVHVPVSHLQQREGSEEVPSGIKMLEVFRRALLEAIGGEEALKEIRREIDREYEKDIERKLMELAEIFGVDDEE